MGAYYERGTAKLVDGDESNQTLTAAGAAYVYTRSGTTWSKQAYIKASNTRANAYFGWSVALFGDTLAVGAYGESSKATGGDGDDSDASAANAGAVYLYERRAGVWSKSSYVKASNTRAHARFGDSIALTGTLLAVGAIGESSVATYPYGHRRRAGAGALVLSAAYGETRSEVVG